MPRSPLNASLAELIESAERVENGVPLTPELDQALFHGSSIGGARPKACIGDEDNKYIAKFSLATDLYSVVKAEFVAMRLARLAGLDAAPVSLTQASKRDVLLVERFDRRHTDEGWLRKNVVSALTLLGLDEMMARYASYEDLAEIIRHRFSDPTRTGRELFARLVFNVLSGNTDDHARNHAAFCDGGSLTLTPAYDICPQARAGNEASQAMLISGDNRMSRISSCLDAAHHFLLSPSEAQAIVADQITAIGSNCLAVCEEAELNETDGLMLTTRQFLNPFGFYDLDGNVAGLARLADDVRAQWRR